MAGIPKKKPNPEQRADSLTKRELFAAMAMQGLVAEAFATDPQEASRLAVKHADALLAALEAP